MRSWLDIVCQYWCGVLIVGIVSRNSMTGLERAFLPVSYLMSFDLCSHHYSPNNLLTLRRTLSFSGSYGWSFDGISRTAGKASWNLSTVSLIFSAMCWLMRTMPTSFLSFVKRLNADSIVDVSVLLSQTRKFRCESGGSVTCPTPANRSPVTELRSRQLTAMYQLSSTYSSSPITARNCRSYWLVSGIYNKWVSYITR